MAAPFWPAASVTSRTDTPRPWARNSCSATSRSCAFVLDVAVGTATVAPYRWPVPRFKHCLNLEGSDSMAELRFDGEVASVTCGGRGLCRAYARLLAARGCQVVVNGPGVATHGGPEAEGAADEVVREIADAGGIAVADRNSVIDGGDAIAA